MNTPQKIVLIGAGNLATSLAVALHSNGHDIVQVWSRTAENAALLAERVGAVPCSDLAEIKHGADLYIYAVKDDALPQIIDAVKIDDGLHAHTSGSVPMTIFEGKRTNYGSIYPFQTFSKARVVDFSEIPLLIDANSDDNAKKLANIGKTISQNVLRMIDEDRQYLHLAGVFANNFSNSLFVMAEEILAERNLPFSLLLPLLTESIAKLKKLQPLQAQTGPAKRNDQKIIQKQRNLLKNNPELLKVYNLLTDSILQQQNQK